MNDSNYTTLSSYKSSVFYFRRALRATACREQLASIVRLLVLEIELCADFAEGCAIPARQPLSQGEFPAEAEELRAYALTLCLRLEEYKAAIRQRGHIPPKCHIMRSEATDKGW